MNMSDFETIQRKTQMVHTVQYKLTVAFHQQALDLSC